MTMPHESREKSYLLKKLIHNVTYKCKCRISINNEKVICNSQRVYPMNVKIT